MRRFLTILAATLALTPLVSTADAKPLATRWQVMERIAHATWPNACQADYVFPDLMDESTFAETLTGKVNRGPHSASRLCVIAVNRQRLAHEMAPWPVFCRTLVHEWGHLAKRNHVYYGEATQIMYFSITFEPWPGCGASWKTHPLRFMSDAQAARVRYCPTGEMYDVKQPRAIVCARR